MQESRFFDGRTKEMEAHRSHTDIETEVHACSGSSTLPNSTTKKFSYCVLLYSRATDVLYALCSLDTTLLLLLLFFRSFSSWLQHFFHTPIWISFGSTEKNFLLCQSRSLMHTSTVKVWFFFRFILFRVQEMRIHTIAKIRFLSFVYSLLRALNAASRPHTEPRKKSSANVVSFCSVACLSESMWASK